jgi:hypothetical protein
MIDFTGQVAIVTGAGRGAAKVGLLGLANVIAIEGVPHGILAEHRASVRSADDIAAHLAELSTTEPFTVPTSIFDEVLGICERLGISA